MTDQELLTIANRALGDATAHPLTFNNDSGRLCDKLEIDVLYEHGTVYARGYFMGVVYGVPEDFGDDKAVARRRAVVKAAVKIQLRKEQYYGSQANT